MSASSGPADSAGPNLFGTHSSGIGPPGWPEPEKRDVVWVFLGPHGLRAGWSVLLAYCLFRLLRLVVGTIFVTANLVDDEGRFSASTVAVLELIPFLAMLGTGWVMARLEQRRLADYNLRDARGARRFVLGVAAGFVTLSALVGALGLGGWLRFGAPALIGVEILRLAALWGCAYLLVGCVEEGIFRCYLQSTLTRGIGFWWALAAVMALCLYGFFNSTESTTGVYLAAGLGLLPCLLVHLKKAERSAFWQAAWVTSTAFGLIHTYNNGETWMGILAAASIGFVFCVSVRLTGSAWWAIGCHAAWDWSETYFYGTPDSGLPAQGHLLTTSPIGNPLLSGGADGPEGSALAIGAVALLLFLLLGLFWRRKPAAPIDRGLAAD
jgi:uncharacterized protein